MWLVITWVCLYTYICVYIYIYIYVFIKPYTYELSILLFVRYTSIKTKKNKRETYAHKTASLPFKVPRMSGYVWVCLLPASISEKHFSSVFEAGILQSWSYCSCWSCHDFLAPPQPLKSSVKKKKSLDELRYNLVENQQNWTSLLRLPLSNSFALPPKEL
jgi:hypothetical protein